MDMERRFRQVQRHTTARSVFDWIALACLGSSIAFWMTLHWAWLAPARLLSMQSIVAVVMGLIYSLVTPLLWSAMAPSTPAGMMLQRTQTRTWGFVAMLAATGFLTWHGWRLIWSWWMAQPNVVDTGEAMSLAISCLIGFVLIPALAWTATTPEKWMAAIEQAHQVKKLEIQQRGELAIIKASLLRAETLAAIGWANLLPLEKEEAIGSLKGLLMASSDTMRSIVRTLGMSSDLERSIMNDDEIASELDYVKSSIDVVPSVDRPSYVPPQEETHALVRAPAHAPSPSGSAEAAPGTYTKPHNGARDIDRRGSSQTIPHHEEYTIAYEHYRTDTAWSVKMLAEVLGIEPETAGKRRRAWEGVGLVSGEGLSNGRYRFVA